jgi:hypothetical protein
LKHTPTHIQTHTLLSRRMPLPSDWQMLRVKQEKGNNTQHLTKLCSQKVATELLQSINFGPPRRH